VKKLGLKSLRMEMLTTILGLSLLICVAFCVAAITMSRSAIKSQMDDSLTKVTVQGAMLASERIEKHFEALENIARDSSFVNAAMNQFQIQTLLTKQQAAGGYIELMYAGKSGKAYNGAGETFDVSGAEHYIRSMAGERYVSSPTPVEGADQMIMTYSVPIVNEDAVTGVLIMTTDGYELSDIVSDITYAKTGYAFIIDGEGVMLAHPDREMVRTQDRTLEKAENDPAQKGLADMMHVMIEGMSGIGEYTYKGVTKYAGYAPIKGTKWSMALTAPRDEVFEGIERLQQVLLLAAIILAVVSVFAALMIADRLHKPILKLTRAAEKFSTGDLDVELDVHQKNEIGVLAGAFSAIAVNMSNILRSIYNASEQVAAGSKQIADSGAHLAQGSTEQASALEELSASVEQLASQTRANASSASEANELANTARSLAERGNEKMGNMLKAMAEIDQSSANINRIIKVIDDIAFQTNILALNAAVEAARAGEHGKGFAVVAEEVRNLAAKSAAAAKETSGLIEDSSKSVSSGSKLARETAEALERIVSEVSRVAALVNGISVSSGEQSSGIEQINQGLMQISRVVQSISATSQQSAAATKQLTAQADALRQQVAGFTLKRLDAPAADGAPEAPDRPINSSKNRFFMTEANAAGPRPARISLGKGDVPKAPVRPTKISLGEEDDPSTPPAKRSQVALSDSEFGKY